jgi:hypothetical protein
MAGPKTKQQELQEDRAGPAASRERASADYEQPGRDVADMPDPVQMSANKARAGVQVPGMRLVLIGGIVLTLLGYFVGYWLFYS